MTAEWLGIEVGSWADWVSGIGSISAAVIALWLSGAERRARRDADRPTVSCEIHEPAEGWLNLFLEFDNPSSKKWRCVGATVSHPRDGLVVRQRDTKKKVDVSRSEFDEDTRAENAKRTIKLRADIGPFGSQAPSYAGGGRGDYTWERLQLECGTAKRFTLHLSFESYEPIPDKFVLTIKRELSDAAPDS